MVGYTTRLRVRSASNLPSDLVCVHACTRARACMCGPLETNRPSFRDEEVNWDFVRCLDSKLGLDAKGLKPAPKQRILD